MYEEQLKELGLTDNEVKIYLLLLEYGMMNPFEISQKLGLHRGYIYDALERMQEKEVVNSILKNNKKYFQATNPENLVELLKLKLENFQKIVPDLMRIIKLKKEETKVELHKGERAYRILLKDIISSLKNNDEVYLIGIDEGTLLKEVEPIYLKQYLNVIKSKNIKEKIIIKKGYKQLKNYNIKYKELDEKYIGKTAQIIYNNKIAIFIMGTPYYLIIIENKEVAETYKKQFDLLWSIAK
ncbi:MAG: helix-turn-helix domain-containing protein [Candidatus Nanoarchaeia archaeon]|nr:helix-turn-helix domain-containing protein [Candidatus Nanoarchaeia archaeon]MDD5588229.1 helix-turn-helix domain-containing protein [Candidatus Nanoarchaeia archaeon]